MLDEAELTHVRRHKIGFVFQFFHLVPRLTALENVELPMVFAGVPSVERRERAMRTIADVGLSKRESHRPDQLSGGERQRVALARATVMGPSLVLADEPTGNLDGETSAAIIDLFRRLHGEGQTIVMVTHDVAIANVADRQLTLSAGLLGDEGRSS